MTSTVFALGSKQTETGAAAAAELLACHKHKSQAQQQQQHMLHSVHRPLTTLHPLALQHYAVPGCQVLCLQHYPHLDCRGGQLLPACLVLQQQQHDKDP